MTLFKKVFQKHLEDYAAAEAAGVAEGDVRPDLVPPAVDLAPPPELAVPQPKVHPGLPEMTSKGAAPAADVPETAASPAPATPAAAPAIDPALVARAAEAHRMMVETQARTAPSDPAAPLPGRSVPSATDAAASAPASSSRTRTRLLGFGGDAVNAANPLDGPAAVSPQAPFPCGWLVITSGPGRGESFALHTGVAMIGRGDDQAICLDFGDRAISRQNHAAVAYDPETAKFYLGHGGKSNIIRLNGNPVLSTEELSHGDTIRIGETQLRFAAFCDATFTWSEAEE